MENRKYLVRELIRVEKWEKKQQKVWIWERIGRLPFKVLDKLTPAFIQNKVGQALDELGYYIQSGGKYLINKKKIVGKFGEGLTLEDIADLPLIQMDENAVKYGVSRARFATLQGATTGFGGVFTLAADIPTLLGLSLKILQEIAICYGYDPNDKMERIFNVKCLQFATSDVVGKQAVLNDLKYFREQEKKHRTASQLQSWREVIMTYREHFGWKKLFQLVPIAGMLAGAMMNRSMIENVAETGRMFYRKRRILDRLEPIKEDRVP